MCIRDRVEDDDAEVEDGASTMVSLLCELLACELILCATLLRLDVAEVVIPRPAAT